MSLRNDTSASAQALAFLVAASIFMGVVAVVFIASNQSPADHSVADAATQNVEAESLADLLVGSQGVGWAGGADQIGRLGLGAYNGSGLQQSSIDALKGAMVTSSANGKVDYEDAQRSLGIDPASGQDFHIRVYPVGMDSVYDASLSGTRVAYIANWGTFTPVVVPLLTPNALVPTVANTLLNVTMGSYALNEREALELLGLGFDNQVYLNEAASNPDVDVDVLLGFDETVYDYLGVEELAGDVYPDQKQYLDDVLPDRLDSGMYDVLVVGSGVDHSSLTGEGVKDGIRDWVSDGGMLIVMGSSLQGYQWLQPLFFTGVSTVNGAALAPDVSHPLLKEPNELAWTSYDSHGRGWDIKDQGSGAHYDDFSHVIVQGGEDVMAISKDGAFGSGRIMLTTYLPGEVAGTLGLQEAMNFFENIALFADRANLYLEYGPTAPANTPVSVAVRQSWLYDAVLGQVPARIEVATWNAA